MGLRDETLKEVQCPSEPLRSRFRLHFASMGAAAKKYVVWILVGCLAATGFVLLRWDIAQFGPHLNFLASSLSTMFFTVALTILVVNIILERSNRMESRRRAEYPLRQARRHLEQIERISEEILAITFQDEVFVHECIEKAGGHTAELGSSLLAKGLPTFPVSASSILDKIAAIAKHESRAMDAIWVGLPYLDINEARDVFDALLCQEVVQELLEQTKADLSGAENTFVGEDSIRTIASLFSVTRDLVIVIPRDLRFSTKVSNSYSSTRK